MQDKNKERLAQASALVSRHLGLEVVASAIHGSTLRGYSDPNSDIDMCFLVNRPVSDFVNVSCVPYFEGTLEERRKKVTELSSKLTRELGWPIMVSLLDMRAVLRGILNSSTFTLMAYECFAQQNDWVKYLFQSLADDYFRPENIVYRCGEHISKAMHSFSLIPTTGMEYRQERTYLGTLWSAHRLLAYINGDRQHCRTIDELITMNSPRWSESLPAGFRKEVIGVIRARTHRSPFDSPTGVSSEAIAHLKDFVHQVLHQAVQYVQKNPRRIPTTREETREMVDLYQALIDHEDEQVEALAA